MSLRRNEGAVARVVRHARLETVTIVLPQCIEQLRRRRHVRVVNIDALAIEADVSRKVRRERVTEFYIAAHAAFTPIAINSREVKCRYGELHRRIEQIRLLER